jgi:hypothetical protein
MSKRWLQPSIPRVVCHFQVFSTPPCYLQRPLGGALVPGAFIVVAGPAAVSSTQPTQCSSGQSQEFSGKVAVIDRGVCPFADKVCRAQLNGAIAVIVVNNVDGSPSTMGGFSRYMIFFGQLSRAYLTLAQVLHNFYPIGDDFKGGWSHSKIEAACQRFG